MRGVIFSLTAGIFITLHLTFNSRLSEELGVWHTTTIIHLIGFTVSLLIFLFVRDGNGRMFKEVPFLYLFGGTFGVISLFGQISAINLIGPTFAIAVLLIAQLFSAFFIESRGLFGEQKLYVNFQQIIGIVMMIIGVTVFKL